MVGFEPESKHGANNGLAIARDILEKIHAKHPEISYGDLWTLAGVCAVQELVNIFLVYIFFWGLTRMIGRSYYSLESRS